MRFRGRERVSTSVNSWLPLRQPSVPSNLAPQLWLDAADAATITESSGLVSQWVDKSGNGVTVTQSNGAAQPTYVTAALNGRNVIDFNGSNFLIRTTASNLGRNVSGATVYLVRLFNVSPTVEANIVRVEAAGTATRIGLFGGLAANKSNAGGRTLDADAFARVDSATNISTTNYSIQTGVFDYANTDLFLYLNSTLEGTNSSFQSATTTSNTASPRLGIGGVSPGNAFNGRIAEVLIYHAAHDAMQRNQIWDYLAAKWGITL
jgi:hypothetical protein